MERLERLIVKDYKQETKTHRQQLMQNHRVRKRLDKMQECANKLVRARCFALARSASRVCGIGANHVIPLCSQMKVYEDDDNARREEISSLGGPLSTVFGKFYERLREAKDYHRRFPSTDFTEVGTALRLVDGGRQGAGNAPALSSLCGASSAHHLRPYCCCLVSPLVPLRTLGAC